MNKPLVSIIIGNYNKGNWLTECLFSAFNQTYSPIEVCLYDDGSDDQSSSIIDVFKGVPNFVYKMGDHSGKPAVSYNKALDLAKGEYIAFLGSDDVLTPFFVEDLMSEVLKDPSLCFLFSQTVNIDENRKVVRGPDAPRPEDILNRCSVGLVSSIVKRSTLIELGGFDESLTYSEDWDLVLRLFKSEVPHKYVAVSNYLGRWVVDDIGLSKQKGTQFPDYHSEKRIESHRAIRNKHKLPGPCGCGCGTVGFSYPKREGGPTISASMIVKNEEEVLRKCLNSIYGIDEIVILDTGSTDKTGEVVQEFGKSTLTDLKYIVNEYKWSDNFAEARNESLKRCTSDWILIIDADEQLENGGLKMIRDLLDHTPDTVRAISFRTISSNGGLVHDSVRLFRNNSGIIWHGAIHNYLSARANYNSNISLQYGYSPAHAKDPDRALRILTREVEKDPNCLRERFYLAREYYYRQRWPEAIEHYRLYLEKAHWAPEKAEAWMQVSRCYANSGMVFEARLACLRAVEINADFKDALKWMATLSQDEESKKKWESYATLAKNTNTLFHSMDQEETK
jgi:glycosyltransferase involved in cell wall biosynthesis